MDSLDERRRMMVRTALMGLAAAAVVMLLCIWIIGPDEHGVPGETGRLIAATSGVLVLSLVLLPVNKFVSHRLAAAVLLLAFVAVVPLTDTAYQIATGRSVFWFVLPIVMSSVLLFPAAGFFFSTLCGAILFGLGMTLDPPVLNWVGVIGYFLLAAVMWLSSRTLEDALRHALRLTDALADSEERYRGIFEHSMSGIGVHRIVRDEDGVPCDYTFLEVNRAFQEQTGLSAQDIVGQNAYAALPNSDTNRPFVDIYGGVVDTGKTIHFEQYSESLDRTYDISAFGVGEDQFVTIFTDISERVRYDREREMLLADMRRQADELSSVLETVPVAVLMLADDGRILMANNLAETLLADAAEVDDERLVSLAGQPLTDLAHGPAQRYWQGLDVGDRRLEVTVRAVHEIEQNGWVLVVRDTTQQRDFERRLQQQDRLAVIGQLAGGIAHDFNNLLTTILGFAEFALESAETGTSLHDDISEVREAGLRAAALTQQLLAFSRRQLLQPRQVMLCDVIREMRRMLDGLLEEAIELEFELADCGDTITVDPVQVQQVIMNLCVNARDAMPEGGRLTIGVHTVSVGPDEVQYVAAGDYVMLTVADTGTGMTDEVKQHIFEPFFTTKDVGKGTGLGLATVFGIVRQSEGRIAVESELGKGTTFRVYFPISGEGEESLEESRASAPAMGGDEVILLVEDEAAVRRLARRELEQLGYVVLEAERPSVALALSRAAQTIDLLLTDVVMPEMDGAALATEIRKQRPDLRVLYVSGYTDRNLDQIVQPGSRARFMEKPYNSRDLALTVRAILDQT